MLRAAVYRIRYGRRGLLGPVGVASLAAAAGILLSVVTGPAVGGKAGIAPPSGSPTIDATHLPPLLTLAGERIALRYDINCPASTDNPETGCRGAGTVFLRSGESGAFTAIPLRLDPQAAEGRYVAEVPPAFASSPTGFFYYAELRDDSTGARTVLPAGGAKAPQRSVPLQSPAVVALGTHVFGAVGAANARVAAAAWGNGPNEVGLEEGRQAPIGASSFDVGLGGTVNLLDEAHKRVLRWGADGSVSSLPLQIDGTLADLAVSPEGSIYVLESTGHGTTPLLRSFGPDGTPRATWHTAERAAAAVRIGPRGPVVLQYPSSEWMPIVDGVSVLQASAQAQQGSVGRPLPDVRGDVVVSRLHNGRELRLALVGPGGAQQGWRITSRTPIGEVQLAQPLGNRLVAVLATYTDRASEFVALVLDKRGTVRQFSLPAADWAESAPISRFRLAGSSLYQLGSTPSEAFVDRYDLGVK